MWVCGCVGVWWFGGVEVWWCGGVVVWVRREGGVTASSDATRAVATPLTPRRAASPPSPQPSCSARRASARCPSDRRRGATVGLDDGARLVLAPSPTASRGRERECVGGQFSGVGVRLCSSVVLRAARSSSTLPAQRSVLLAAVASEGAPMSLRDLAARRDVSERLWQGTDITATCEAVRC